jgi:hypothetical protein
MLKQLAILLLLFSCKNSFCQCDGTEPIVFLGNDSILCQGESIILQAPVGYELYEWSTGSNANSITVSSEGQYSVNCIIMSGGTNLVQNGNFELGDIDFESDYIYGTGGSWGLLSNPGQYAISTSPSNTHNNFYYCEDHTSGSGNMFIANGSDIANTIVWEQIIPVQPSTYYNFSAWVTSVENTSNAAQLQFFVNDVQIGAIFSPSDFGCDWQEFYNLWYSESNTSAKISIKNQNIDGGGNDFALDDISFTSFCTQTDTINISYDTLTISTPANISFCDNSPEYIKVESNVPSTTYLWSTNETSDSIIPTQSGIIIVTATSSNGCEVNSNTLVETKSTPIAEFESSVYEGTVPLNITITENSSYANTHDWNLGNGETFTSLENSTFDILYDQVGNYITPPIFRTAD